MSVTNQTEISKKSLIRDVRVNASKNGKVKTIAIAFGSVEKYIIDGNRQERSHGFITLLKIALEIIMAQITGKRHNSENAEHINQQYPQMNQSYRIKLNLRLLLAAKTK